MASTSKAIELQLQVKQNAEELQDFMRDLEHWENDIRQKDMELRRQGGVPEEVKEGFWYDNLLLVCVQCVCVHTHQHAWAQLGVRGQLPGIGPLCGIPESTGVIKLGASTLTC